MGGRGGSGNRNQASTSSSGGVRQDIDNFLAELENREYGSSKKMVQAAQEGEFRRTKYDILSYLKEGDYDTIIPSSGFTVGALKPQEYKHTAAKLNAYQRLVRSEVKALKMDMEFGIVDEDRARLELRALRSLDKTIADRRGRL